MFVVPAGWRNDRAFADGGGVSNQGGGFLWASGVTKGLSGGATVDIAPGVDGFLAHLKSFKGFTVTEPVPVTVDGVEGRQVDVTTNDVEAPGLYIIADDGFNLAPGEKARFIVLDKDGATVILIIEGFKDTEFDATVATTQTILDSVSWE
jgi:hypothetical protein